MVMLHTHEGARLMSFILIKFMVRVIDCNE